MELGFVPAKMPKSTPKNTPNINPPIESSMVGIIFSLIILVTGCLVKYDLPKSPLVALTRKDP